jgi:putative oxidoreductase
MSDKFLTYGLWALKILAGLAFLAAGLAKLAGAAMMVGTFDAIGVGQWFRYVTGIIEVAGAIALFVPGFQAIGALFLGATMVGAVLAHLFILGPSAVPAIILGIISAIILWRHRDQLPVVGNSTTA